ncbi:hypothetical protein [Novosphingobium sp. TCA1]|uniref:hypothetical protein n=1 Tax=Novosphingobium sp. TCA1 TaxID=2682474 RepID=UPI00130A49EC|nr:hypothetical protein [Novosphingobium sp. TCA1]GFE73496.1 hypothetical protein NTCA1_11450 [Novosphingobium sp. TCA1]
MTDIDMDKLAKQLSSAKMPNGRAMSSGEMIAAMNSAANAILAMAENADAWDWLSQHCQLELSFAGWDDENAWQVHAVHGGRNDREWTLVGEGETALAAVIAARRALGKDKA